ncbi:MAG: HAMP domain-containing histidine kinase [Bacilli bacterium]|jgi:signal transduction histidine kinase|nr:HAMP domain-containing histidine kinase [Bacilli bacterium]
MNNKIIYKWRYIIGILLAIYIIGLVVIIAFNNNIIHDYQVVSHQNNELVIKQINEALKDNNLKKMDQIERTYPVEFVIRDEKNTLYYATFKDVTNLNDEISLKDNYYALKKTYSYHVNNHQYHVLFVQYYSSPGNIFSLNKILVYISGIIVFAIFAGSLIIVYRFYFIPLELIKNNVAKISKFNLDLVRDVDHRYGSQLNDLLLDFADNLEKAVNRNVINYNHLEKELYKKNELLQSKSTQVSSLTHDLKGPINIISLQANQLLNNNLNNVTETLEDIRTSTQELILQINDISKFIYQDKFYVDNSNLDVLDCLCKILKNYNYTLISKNVDLEIISDEQVMFYTNVVNFKIIINNAVSNLVNYSLENSSAYINIYCEANKLHMIFYNEAELLSDFQIKNIFQLFYRASNDNNGSGVGLYSLKVIVEELNGSVSFVRKTNGVELRIIIPLS